MSRAARSLPRRPTFAEQFAQSVQPSRSSCYRLRLERSGSDGVLYREGLCFRLSCSCWRRLCSHSRSVIGRKWCPHFWQILGTAPAGRLFRRGGTFHKSETFSKRVRGLFARWKKLERENGRHFRHCCP